MANETIKSVNDAGKVVGGTFFSGYCGVGTSAYSNSGALRFTNINISQGASINFARLYLEYSSVGAGSSDWKWKLTGIDEDNTAAIDAATWGRSRTSAEINFDEGVPVYPGSKTLDVQSILKEIVDRGGFSSGNAIGFNMSNEGSDGYVYANFNVSNSYLAYRLTAEPNFKPTPKSVSAPSLPDASNFGIKISKANQSVLTATEADLYFTTRRKQFKVKTEGLYTATGAGDTTIAHNLGYIPFVSVYCKADTFVGSDWVRLPHPMQFEDHPWYYVDDTNLYLHAVENGDDFYYYIFLDELAS